MKYLVRSSKYRQSYYTFRNILHNNKIIDEVLVSIFNNSKSFTGESVEISCHGSTYIQNKISKYS